MGNRSEKVRRLDMSVGNPFEPLLALRQPDGVGTGDIFGEEVVVGGLDLSYDEIDFEDSEGQSEDEDGDDDEFEYDTDEIDDVFESQLLSAQQQWEESLEQLNKVLNWVLLPLVGKFMGRRMAKVLWQHAMEYLWS